MSQHSMFSQHHPGAQLRPSEETRNAAYHDLQATLFAEKPEAA